jgi:hypothetical protein
MVDWAKVYERLKARIEACGVQVFARPLDLDTTGVFDGLSIITNTAYDLETRCHNIAHSFGHIVQWSLDYQVQQQLYDDLHAAKANKATDPGSLERALERFRVYEEVASQYATWLLADSGNPDAVAAFTNFARADIEAIVGFHRDGVAAIWCDFFDEWNQAIKRHGCHVMPFSPKAIPTISPRPIEPQEVIRGVGAKGIRDS